MLTELINRQAKHAVTAQLRISVVCLPIAASHTFILFMEYLAKERERKKSF